jgi:surface polysaccharide O-acyltransferase-like enzyme
MHSPHPDAGISGMVLSPLSFLTAAGIGLFFMVSGALLLPVKIETGDFLKKRIGKIIGPLLFWTLFYMVVGLLTGRIQSAELPKSLLSIPFSTQGHGVLWFMYTLAGLYLLAPILSPFLERASERELRFYLLLWAVALCFPILALFLDVNRSTTGMLYYFTGYVGYFVLGYYLHAYKPRVKTIFMIAMIIVPLVFFAIHRYYSLDGDFFDVFGYLSITIVVMSFAWFIGIRSMIEQLRLGGAKLLTELSNACFGIYLVHIFIMRNILWHSDFIVHAFGGIGQIVMTWMSTFAISFALTYLISYLPYAEYIVGYKHKKQK